MTLGRLLCPPCMATAFKQKEDVAEVCGLKSVAAHVALNLLRL